MAISIASAHAQIETVLYNFKGVSPDGYSPYDGVVRKNGALYGTTAFGGKYGFGTVFKISGDGTERVLHSFDSKSGDGFEPTSGLTLDKTGNFYGTTFYGGAYGYGSVYTITPRGAETVIYSFGGKSADGEHPWAALTLYKAGNLYGTTVFGGTYGRGTVFKVTPTGIVTALYSFGSQPEDGSRPYGEVVLDSFGNLYGTNSMDRSDAGLVKCRNQAFTLMTRFRVSLT